MPSDALDPLPEVTAPPPAPPPRRGGLIVSVLLLAVLGGAAGLLLGPYRAVLDRLLGVAPPVDGGPAPVGIDLAAPPAFVNLESFTVNLREDEGRRYVQLVMSLRFARAEDTKAVAVVMPEIRHRINLLIAGKLPSQISAPADRERLALEIAREANLALNYPAELDAQGDLQTPGPVRAVRFNSFLIQ